MSILCCLLVRDLWLSFLSQVNAWGLVKRLDCNWIWKAKTLLVTCDLYNYVSEHSFILVRSFGQRRAAHDASQTWQKHLAVPLLHNFSFSQNIKYLKSCRGAWTVLSSSLRLISPILLERVPMMSGRLLHTALRLWVGACREVLAAFGVLSSSLVALNCAEVLGYTTQQQ